MQHALQLLQAGWHAFQLAAPCLVTMFIPSVIISLTPYPRAVTVSKTVLNFLSVLAHSDSPGTFKAPFTMSPPPADTPPDATSGPTPGGASVAASMGPPAAAGVALAVLEPVVKTPPVARLAAGLVCIVKGRHGCCAIDPPQPRAYFKR